MAEPTDLDRVELAVLLDDVRGSAARLDAALDTLTDLEAREPSTLAGWSRGHVITHLARSADVYRWLLTLARTGAESGPRADAATLEPRAARGRRARHRRPRRRPGPQPGSPVRRGDSHAHRPLAHPGHRPR
ncbi:maleylpyruvate isomerase N-terminal domain-containing protein [Streptomyces sp. NPDC006692]|uniref:maleylpyruvate isomerase N-terminal domain-containing protein n=1 Tax=Streptomyces sp. NPDC006692 TaxID=3364758 RepID=UPI0036BB355C